MGGPGRTKSLRHSFMQGRETMAQQIAKTLKNNSWIILVAAFAILIAVGIAVS